MSGRSPEMSTQSATERPLVVLKRCPAVVGVFALNPETATYAVLPVRSRGSTAMPVIDRFGRGGASMNDHGAMPAPLTSEDTATRPSDAPVYNTSFPPIRRG